RRRPPGPTLFPYTTLFRSCVGMKGMRVQSIIRELRGEKIDIIEYQEDSVTFAEKALQPAKVSRVSVLDASDKHLEVIVDDSQLRSEEHTSELQSRGHLVCR